MVDTGKLISCCIALACFVCNLAFASETEESGVASRPLSFIPYVRKNPCARPYRQLAFSPPLQGTSDSGEGYPWRLLYGYCVAETGRLSVHQDWVVSYLDVTPRGDAPDGQGVSFGTDFSLHWRHKQGMSFTPYYEAGLGLQYAAGTPFPADGSRWMFTINAGAGFLIPLKTNLQLNTAIRYLHISNAGWLGENAGYDGFHMVIGIRWQ